MARLERNSDSPFTAESEGDLFALLGSFAGAGGWRCHFVELSTDISDGELNLQRCKIARWGV